MRLVRAGGSGGAPTIVGENIRWEGKGHGCSSQSRSGREGREGGERKGGHQWGGRFQVAVPPVCKQAAVLSCDEQASGINAGVCSAACKRESGVCPVVCIEAGVGSLGSWCGKPWEAGTCRLFCGVQVEAGDCSVLFKRGAGFCYAVWGERGTLAFILW